MHSAFTFKIGGEAGFGVMSAGLVFSRIATRSGYHIFNYTEYPSVIRGGHNVMQTTVSIEEVNTQYKHTDFLVALNQETLNLHKDELSKDAGVLLDPENVKHNNLPKGVTVFEIPMLQIVRDVQGSFVMRNTVALGAAVAALGGDLQHLKNMISEEFGDKKAELIQKNHKACEEGYNYVIKNYKDKIKKVIAPQPKVDKKIVLTGNEAISFASVAAGVGFVSIYPMTPTSNVMHNLAPLQDKYNFVFKQPEDEISAINMAIGASFAGVRSMVATSGGGFCLMSEGYGLAGITETPIVIIMGMRPGPATGLPTWTSQGDLRFVLHAHQDEFPKIILAPGDIKEVFDQTMLAFNLADKYQTPVLVLVDKYLCESQFSTPIFDYSNYEIDRGKLTTEFVENFERYKDSQDGISLRSVPGSGNYMLANSDEHDTIGYSTELIEMRNIQMNKRMKKLKTCEAQDMQMPKLYGPANADLTIISWGSNKGPIMEALKYLNNVNYLHLTWINPFPTEATTEVLSKSKNLLNIESNFSGQMQGLIKERTGIDIKNNFLKYDGRPFYPEEIISKVKELL